jgi:hypothetical protein
MLPIAVLRLNNGWKKLGIAASKDIWREDVALSFNYSLIISRNRVDQFLDQGGVPDTPVTVDPGKKTFRKGFPFTLGTS